MVPLLPLSLSLAILLTSLGAQGVVPDPIDVVVKRFQNGGDLLEMQWRREASGRLLTCPKGSDDWQPLVADSIGTTFQMTGVVGWLMTWLHGDNDLLGMTDGERHLRRVGVATSDVELRTYLALPLPAGADARHPEVLDRMIAIDMLRRRGTKGAAAEFGALAARPGVPAALQRRAQDALALLQGGTRAAPLPLDPATLLLPVAADAYVIFDNSRVPDPSRLAGLGRHLGLQSSLMVLRMLKEPTLEDFRTGQTESDAIGELPFEFVRRFGNHRVAQGCIAVQAQAQESGPVGFSMQLAGEFDQATLARTLPVALRELGFEIEAKDSGVTGKSAAFDFQVTATRVGVATPVMRGKPRPELAKKLLANGTAALRIVLPGNSKAWLGLASLEMPGALEGEVAVTFAPVFTVRAVVTVRDEDVAEAWSKRVKELLAENVPKLEALFGAGAPAPLADLLAAVKAIEVSVDGRTVNATLVGKNFGWAVIEALLEKSSGG